MFQTKILTIQAISCNLSILNPIVKIIYMHIDFTLLTHYLLNIICLLNNF